MPRLRNLKSRPRDYLIKKKTGVWPDDPLIDSAPPEALLAHRISILLRDYVDDRGFNPREADAATGISEKTIRNLLDGTVWPHMAMIARLENTLGIPLWVGQHNDGHGTKLELAPRDYLYAGKWPTGPLIEDAPPEAVLAKEISTSFANAYGRYRDIDAAVTKLEVSRGVIESLLNGAAWLDVPTLARVERNLRTRLWKNQQAVSSPSEPRDDGSGCADE